MIAHVPLALMVSESRIPYTLLRGRQVWGRDMSQLEQNEIIRDVFRTLCYSEHGHTRCFIKMPGALMLDQCSSNDRMTAAAAAAALFVHCYRITSKLVKVAGTLCVFMQQLQDSAVVCKAVGTAVVYTALLHTQCRLSVLAVAPLDVVVSNMKGAWGKKEKLQKPVKALAHPCIHLYEHDDNAPVLPDGATPEEQCVANLEHMNSGALAALERHSSYGVAVEYTALPGIFTDCLWQKHFKQSTSPSLAQVCNC
eukprot:12637-Heterococcus_DN1.PRE.4